MQITLAPDSNYKEENINLHKAWGEFKSINQDSASGYFYESLRFFLELAFCDSGLSIAACC